MSIEHFQSDLDRLLTVQEQLLFADQVVWPAIDHLYGGDFRKKARVKRTRLRPKIFMNDSGVRPERITIEAFSPKAKAVTNWHGEKERYYWANIRIEELSPELDEGASTVLETEGESGERLPVPEPETEVPDKPDEELKENLDEEHDDWWNDVDFSWNTWTSRSYDFSNDLTKPFQTYYDLEIQEKDEHEGMLWSFADSPTPPANIELAETIHAREAEVSVMLSYRDCLEIRSALLRAGIPAEKMAYAE